jgi:hypothetical protein
VAREFARCLSSSGKRGGRQYERMRESREDLRDLLGVDVGNAEIGAGTADFVMKARQLEPAALTVRSGRAVPLGGGIAMMSG